MLVWAFLSRLPDLLAFIGFVTVLWWAVKAALRVSAWWRRRAEERA